MPKHYNHDYDKTQLGLSSTGSVQNPQTSDHFAKAKVKQSLKTKDPIPVDGASNADGARHLWDHRMEYMENAPRKAWTSGSLKPLSMIDFWYDKQMYGKVDMEQNPVYISEAYLGFVGNIFMANVAVSKAFKDLTDRWSVLGMQNKIHKHRTVYKPGEIEVTKAWNSVHPQYHAHMVEIFSDFQEWIMLEGRRKKIMTFKDFLQYMIYFIDAETPKRAFTRSGFILSGKCDRSSSGFQIEIAAAMEGDDKQKIINFHND